MAELVRGLERRLAHQPGVRKAVHEAAKPIAAKAKARLAAHKDEGEHEVVLTRGAVDSYVELVGPAPLTLETGRAGGVDVNGRRVGAMEPLRILRGAL